MPNVGYATIQIIPSVRGIADELRSQLVGPSEDAGGDAGEAAGGSLKEKLLVGVAAAGVAAGAILVAGITEAIEQANITSSLQAQLGATGKDAAKYGQVAGKLYSKGITESFQEGADAIRAVVNAGLVPPDATNAQIESIAGKMSDLSVTFGLDMARQTEAVSAMFKNGLAPSAEDALDLITVGFQKLGPNAEDLLDTFQEYSIQFRKLGIDGKEAIGLFQQGIKAGARDTDIIADAFKEFGIRAIDMSKSSQDAYKAIGLDAEKMSLQIAKGGDTAGSGLQLVLDKLRGMKDPVEQNAAAVGLFGTQAEDLGQALFKLDPSTAVGAFGSVTGAAAELGKTLHSGPAHEFEVFIRTLKQGVVDFVTVEVLPALLRLGRAFNSDILPPIRTVAGAVDGPLVAALKGLFIAGMGVIDWLREWGVWLLPAAILVGGLTIALNAQAIATAAVTAVFSIYRGAILLGTAVTSGFTAAQAVLNAVMALNPITLVVIALVALAAALFIAYKKSETFRAIVQAAWQAIQTAALYAWQVVIKPVFDGLMIGLRLIADAAMWLWTNGIKPAFGYISDAARLLATIILTILITPTYLAIKILGAIFGWLWDVAIKPAFDLIAAGAMWLWTNGIKPAFDNFVALLKTVGSVALWLWTNAIKPAWDSIVAGAKWLWNNGIKPAFDNIVAGARALGNAAMWLWTNAIKPAWDGIGAAIRYVWQNWIKPAFDSVSRGVGYVRDSFENGVSAIGRVWDGLRDITRKPVQFIIDTVYNNGIRKVWNTVAEFTGSKQLGVVKFATGGSVFGAGTATSDSIPALLSNGEHVWTAREVRGAGGHAAVEALRARAAAGGSAFAKGGAVGIPRFADGGGVIDWLSGKARQIGGALMDGIQFMTSPGKAWDLATKFIRDQVGSNLSGSQWAQALSQFPIKMLQSLKDKVVSAAEGLIGGSASGSVAAAMGFARSQAGKPYQWGGAGDPSWDCSGFMSGIQKVIQGLSPGGRLWSTFSFQGDTAPAGWKRNLRSPFMIGITNDGVGHTAGTLAGMNVESRGGDGVVVGARARGYNSPLFQDRYGFAPALRKYDSGGWLQPGVTTSVNATGRPEAILTGPQWNMLASLAARGQSGPARFEGDLYLDSGEFLGKVRGEAAQVVDGRFTELTSTLTGGPRRI
ncbi:phage tail tape measure protein [Streptomyces goshikiensis]|uniref:phage tail tape measure protein n=1 Tax=Streptomyces goshikiensis TaxID=1942 RepID=UPI002E115C27|nr:phage tail tape measure protein [Streptomyces goshikiensis]